MHINTPYLVAIEKACGLTRRRYQNLKSFFDNDFEQAFKGSISDWQAAKIDQKGIEKFFSSKVSPEEEIEKLQACGAEVLVYGENSFPLSLLEIPEAPTLLFVRGTIRPADFPALGVVGSRKVTDYGRGCLDHLLEPVISSGVTTVSGLAFGTDRLVHECSLDHGQRTLAVLGNGIDRIYPRSHQKLAERILRNGALISEYLPGVEPRPEHFPQRNRIVSGLSSTVVLVEAAEKSGTLITAAWANDQGRNIFAIPGSIFASQSKGTNQLIVQGLATGLVDALQIKNLYAETRKLAAPDLSDITEIDKAILKTLAQQPPTHIDDIFRSINYPSGVIASQLLLLEVRGWIKDTGQQHYISQL